MGKFQILCCVALRSFKCLQNIQIQYQELKLYTREKKANNRLKIRYSDFDFWDKYKKFSILLTLMYLFICSTGKE